MLSDVWPTCRLQVVTPPVRLHLPDPAERPDLAQLAGRGIHPASERPCLTPWTDVSPTDR